MANYYFLGTLLPELHIDETPEISFKEFARLLRDNLSAGDYAKTKIARNYYDIFNLLSYSKDEPLDEFGNLNESDLEEALATNADLPQYIFDYLNKYETKEERQKHFPQLLATFFNEEIKRTSGEFKAYLILERDLRLILTAYRAKKLGRDVLPELQYEDPEDEIVAQILAQKDAPKYELPEKYEDFKPLIEKYYDDPIAIQKAFIEYRFEKMDQMIGIDFFSVNRLIAYMIKLIMIEKWQRLNKQKGLEIVDSMLKEPL